MTAKARKASKATGRLKGEVTFLDGLKPEEAQAVLQRFLAAHPDLCAEAQRIARSLLHEISFGAVADKVEDAVRAVDFPMIQTTNIRALKDRLRAFLRDVQRGDVILVTDRGRVVAEIRQPTIGVPTAGAGEGKLRRLVADGVLKLGFPNTSDAFRRSGISLPDRVVDEALGWTRGDR